MGTLRFFKALSAFALVLFISCSNDDTDERVSQPQVAETVNLRIEIIPAGSGVVYPYSGSYIKDQWVTLRPDANPGFIFSHWTGDVQSVYHSQVIKMDTDKKITAVFVGVRNDLYDTR
jgi:hypothetical protein